MFASSSQLIILVSMGFLALAIILVFLAARSALEDNRRIKERLQGRPEDRDESSVFTHKKALSEVGNHISLPDPEEISKIRFQLSLAGYYGSSAVKTYYAARLFALVIPQFFVLLFWNVLSARYGLQNTIAIAAGMILVGFMGPLLFIRHKQNKRLLQNKNGFPDMTDLLVACLEAGLGLNAALIRVGNELGRRYPALKTNLDLLNLELRAGRERHVAMHNFAERLNMEEARALSVMIRQSEEMGAGLGKALRTFSDDMRLRRMMKAEEKAMALSAKLTVPLIVFIFPTIMIMLMMPAAERIMASFAAT